MWTTIRILGPLALLVLLAAGTSQAQNAEDILDLKLQIVELQNKGQLGINNFTLCNKIMSYASYVALPENVLPAGGALKVYYEPTFWYTNTTGGRYEMWMTQDIALQTADGQELFRRDKLLNLKMNTAKPVLDVYMTNDFNLGQLPPGEYVYIITLHDELSGQKAEHREPFVIK